MSDTITTQLVGAHFRPPAKALLAVLPAGHPLFLRPEPTNEYDSNAVQVVLLTTSLASFLEEEFFQDQLAGELLGQGFDIETVLEAPEWHLGYLPRAAKGNKALEEWNVQVQQAIHTVCGREHPDDMPIEGATVVCSLSFDSAGKPTVIIPWPPQAE